MTYVLLEVGCLECEEPTRVLGVYMDGFAADTVFEGHAAEYPSRGPEEEFLKGTAIRVTGFGRLQLHDTSKGAA
jgi:hypothetical protein